MTCQPDFSGVWIKLERAREHISKLEALVEGLKQSNPYGVISYCELGTGDLVLRVRASGLPGPLGDADQARRAGRRPHR